MEPKVPDEVQALKNLLVEASVCAVRRPKELLGKLKEMERLVDRLASKSLTAPLNRLPDGSEPLNRLG